MNIANLIESHGLELIRFAWCDTHGILRGKTLTAPAAISALQDGVGMVGTLMLKDTSDRTAFKVFDPAIKDELPGFEFASNLQLMPIESSFKLLPWADKTGWIQCQPVYPDGAPVMFDTRRQLQKALAALAQHGLGMQCGLEVEFHIYKLRDLEHGLDLDPNTAAWPGPAPQVSLIHPGYNLLSENWFDLAEAPLRIVQRVAQALELPLQSLEIELGPSQVEAVFGVTDALTAADNMVLFRSAVKQALRRAGYHATFMCRPPFENIMSSGWHLHQSLAHLDSGANVFVPEVPAVGAAVTDAQFTLSDLGSHYLAGLLNHAKGMTVMCTPTTNGYGRFQPNALAPQSVVWGRDNRGAMLRVIGGVGDVATRIENRLGEPAANPYLYIASQIYAGLAGLNNKQLPPVATDSPYEQNGEGTGNTATRIPTSLADAVRSVQIDTAMTSAFGVDFINYYCRIKDAENQRFEAAEDKTEFHRREYFGRI
ncbi:MAG: glutamine synthetase family protein [Burkholderiaceae bacterium]